MQGHMWTDQAAVLIGSLQLLTSPPAPGMPLSWQTRGSRTDGSPQAPGVGELLGWVRSWGGCAPGSAQTARVSYAPSKPVTWGTWPQSGCQASSCVQTATL